MKNENSKFLELLNSFINQYLPVAMGASRNTIKSYKYAFRLLIEFLNSRNVSSDKIDFSMLNYELISNFLTWLENERNCSPSTKNQRLSALLSFSEYAQNRNFEAASTFRSNIIRIPMKKASKKHRAVFTVNEISCLFHMPCATKEIGFRDQVILCLMYASGARAQEICDLKIRDFQLSSSGATLNITGKGDKTRRIGISLKCAGLLEEFIKRHNLTDKLDGYLFPSQTHEKMTISCVEEIFKKYVSLAKKKHPEMFHESSYPPHSMRHSTASHMLEAGVPLIVIKNFLGHESLQSTQIYAELSQNTVDRHLKEWNEKWFVPDMTKNKEEPEQIPAFLRI
jgi:integrase/recombinase XerD